MSYRPKKSDIPYFIQGIVIVALFGKLFYDSWIAMIILLPIIIPWVCIQKKNAKQQKCRMVGIQFKDAIFSVLTALKAGYSIENAFLDAQKDMGLLYGNNSDICFYLDKVTKGLRNGVSVEKLILSMGKESENADIIDFAQVFSVAKRSGGNMTEIIERTIGVISQKINVEKEIDVLISAKRLEARIMNCVPFFIISYISITSPGFFNVLYHNPFGIILMTICMLTYCFSFLLSEKIIRSSRELG